MHPHEDQKFSVIVSCIASFNSVWDTLRCHLKWSQLGQSTVQGCLCWILNLQCLKNWLNCAGDIAQCVKHLPWKPKDLSSNPQNPCKTWAQQQNPTARWKVETGESQKPEGQAACVHSRTCEPHPKVWMSIWGCPWITPCALWHVWSLCIYT